MLDENKSEWIVGTQKAGVPYRQQLCIVDSLFSTKAGGPSDAPDRVLSMMVLGTFGPAVDYLTARKIREQIQESILNAAAVNKFITGFGYSDQERLDLTGKTPEQNNGRGWVDALAWKPAVGVNSAAAPRSRTVRLRIAGQRGIRVSIPESEHVAQVRICTAQGQTIWKFNGNAGDDLFWDGRLPSGQPAPAKTYFFSIRGADGTHTREFFLNQPFYKQTAESWGNCKHLTFNARRVVMKALRSWVICFSLAIAAGATMTAADTWPTFLHDIDRTGKSTETISVPLYVQWTYHARHAPKPAWPASYTSWAGGVSDPDHWRQSFDKTFHVVSADNRIFFGSSADNKVYCLDAATGKELWSFFTEAPVRFAPTVSGTSVIVGSDDGYVYCLNVTSGALLWKYTYNPSARWICGNQRLISSFPVRTDIAVLSGIGHFGAGVFPSSPGMGARRLSVNVSTGAQASSDNYTHVPEGYLIRVGTNLMCPDARYGDQTFRALSKLLFDEYQGSTIYVGGITFKGDSGRVTGGTWSAPVKGKAYGLAFANGRLFASTSEGYIYCFAAQQVANPPAIEPAAPVAYPYANSAEQQQYQSAAQTIVARAKASLGHGKGYVLVLDGNGGALAHEIARSSDYQVVCVDNDAATIAQARKTLDAAGVYGKVSVQYVASSTLPFADRLFNVVTYDGYAIGASFTGSRTEALRVIRPYGGVAFLSPGTMTRAGRIDKAGEWTHNHASPENNPNSHDPYVGHDFRMQWFGEPGPRPQHERHDHAVAPLWKDGVLIQPGWDYVAGVDAYNGAMLWEKNVPNASRAKNMDGFKDCSHLAMQADYVYMASADKCLVIAAATGEQKTAFTVPSFGRTYQWGYVALVDSMLFGSTEINTINSKPWGVSDNLFAVNRYTGAELWRYTPAGVVVNTTIVIAGGRVIFLESTNTATHGVNNPSFATLFGNGTSNAVALDMKTGRQVWRQTINVSKYANSVYGIYSHDKFIISGSYFSTNLYFDLNAFRGTDGVKQWSYSARSTYTASDHWNYAANPVVVGNNAYFLLADNDGICIDVTSGTEKSWNFVRGGHSCGNASASETHMFWRGANPIAYDVAAATNYRLTTVHRPGCRINQLPAGGMLNIPEHSSGCICYYPLMTSISFLTTAAMPTAYDDFTVVNDRGDVSARNIRKPQLELFGGPTMMISVSDITAGERLDVQVVDLCGRAIFKDAAVSRGTSHVFSWQVRGRTVSSGYYLLVLRTPRHQVEKTVLLVN
jgi:outer membrane protein assembly factor BamB